MVGILDLMSIHVRGPGSIVQLWTIQIMDLDADSQCVCLFLYGLEKANFLSGTKINKLPLS